MATDRGWLARQLDRAERQMAVWDSWAETDREKPATEMLAARIMDWPEDPRTPVDFSALTKPITGALRWGYKLSRRRQGQDVPYTGFDLGKNEKATCLPPDKLLTAESLAFAQEDQGQDLLEVLIILAVQLGIEQGRRLEAEQRGTWEDIAAMLRSRLQELPIQPPT